MSRKPVVVSPELMEILAHAHQPHVRIELASDRAFLEHDGRVYVALLPERAA